MPRYRLNRNYADKRGHGPWLAGAEVELPAEDAQWIEAQTPGTLRALSAPPRDRMMRRAETRAVEPTEVE